MSGPEVLGLTGPQYGMWAAQQLDPDSPSLWTAEAVELEGELDVEALQAAVTQTLRACDALHMRYRDGASGLIQALDPARCVEWPSIDFSTAADPWSEALGWMHKDLARRADLTQGPLFASALLRLGPQRHLWYLRVHHIALDGFAYLLLIHRVAELYSAAVGGPAASAARDWSLAPVVAEDAAYRRSARCAEDRAFWLGRFQGAGEPVTLGRKCAPDAAAHSLRHLLPPAQYPAWQAAARAAGADWASWLVAAIAAWMHARSGAREIALGLLVMNRLGSAALGVPCMAMNVVPLRIALDPGQSFDALVREVAGELRALRPHQRYNYEWLRGDLGLADSHAQLYGPVLNLMPFDRGFVFDGLRSRAHPISVGSVEDLDITVSPLPDGLRLDLEANPQAYPAKVLEAHQAALLNLLDAVIARPDTSLATLAAHCGGTAAEAA
ncbi:condensation domain-containing protein [Lysobacter firmicutimachus]|uniref:Condensation domain-containing protein n=1 Tax=Lysobacter firmicutimachus TaxID=1792846 RepID=A0AAU8MT39_9GAMM